MRMGKWEQTGRWDRKAEMVLETHNPELMDLIAGLSLERGGIRLHRHSVQLGEAERYTEHS